MKQSRRLANLPPYPFARYAREVAKAQNAGLDVIRLDIGSPDLPPAPPVIRALCEAAQRSDAHGYPGYSGLPALRQAMVGYYHQRFGVDLDRDAEVVPLLGSKEGIVNLALAILDPGDIVLVPDPSYAPYAMGTLIAGAEVFPLPLMAERAFLPDLESIPESVLQRAALLWLNYPNNPTGAVAPFDFLVQAVEFAGRHGILLCHDAPYCDVTFGGYVAPSILQVPGAVEVAVEFNSLSKTYNMAGWRIGMAVGQREALAALSRVKSNIDSGLFQPIQEAAIQALATPPAWSAERNALYQERLSLMVASLRAIGIVANMPQAGLYAWGRLPAGTDSETYAQRLLHQTGVAVAPGSFFGAAGEGYIRLAATEPSARIAAAMERVRYFRP
jgi:LL-diaminopimelate aminotransferase